MFQFLIGPSRVGRTIGDTHLDAPASAHHASVIVLPMRTSRSAG
jgi:hypothetical protein